MDDLLISNLKEIVTGVISEIPLHYRCHELARKLKEVFQQEGFQLKVKDGTVLYCPMTLFQEAAKGNCKIFKADESVGDAEIIRAARFAAVKAMGGDLSEIMKWRLIIHHSWCILPREKLLIDCHASIDLLQFSNTALFREFPILRKVRFDNLVRIVPFSKKMFRPMCHSGDDIFLELPAQKDNVIRYPGGCEVRLQM